MTRMLFYRLFEYLEFLKPFLELLNRLPPTVHGVGPEGFNVDTKIIESDPTIHTTLSRI